MIGDVKKAKDILGKLVGTSVLKGLLRWMKDDLSYSTRLVNVDSFVNTVTTECKIRDVAASKGYEFFWKKLKSAIKLLSTGPHTRKSGNFYKYVRNEVKQTGVYVAGGEKYPKETYKNLKKYLTLSKDPKKDPNAEGRKKHEDLNAKMGGLREVSRLKILAAALTMALLREIEYKRTSAELVDTDKIIALYDEAKDVRARLKAGKL